jgi:hypothetical protein
MSRRSFLVQADGCRIRTVEDLATAEKQLGEKAPYPISLL